MTNPNENVELAIAFMKDLQAQVGGEIDRTRIDSVYHHNDLHDWIFLSIPAITKSQIDVSFDNGDILIEYSPYNDRVTDYRVNLSDPECFVKSLNKIKQYLDLLEVDIRMTKRE